MKFPEIIIIGATKCGTTALWYNLNKHPDIHMATKSQTSIEMDFWGGIKYREGFNWYKTKFPNDKLGGEKTAGYFANTKALRLISEYIPNVKLFYCVRNPVDRAYSNFQMNRKAGKIFSFDRNIFRKRYSTEGRYICHIQDRILKYFNKDQLYICVAEKMKNNSTEEMKKIFSYIGVEDLNFSSKIIPGELLKHRSRQEDIALSNEEQFYRVWSKHTEQLTGSFRNELLDYYKSYNERLFNFLGYEIKEWSK